MFPTMLDRTLVKLRTDLVRLIGIVDDIEALRIRWCAFRQLADMHPSIASIWLVF